MEHTQHTQGDVALRGKTFATPFIISTFLAYPTLLVVAYSKQNVGYSLLVDTGYYYIIMSILGVLLAISLVSSLVYVWRGQSHAAKTAVVILEVVALACLGYIVLD